MRNFIQHAIFDPNQQNYRLDRLSETLNPIPALRRYFELYSRSTEQPSASRQAWFDVVQGLPGAIYLKGNRELSPVWANIVLVLNALFGTAASTLHDWCQQARNCGRHISIERTPVPTRNATILFQYETGCITVATENGGSHAHFRQGKALTGTSPDAAAAIWKQTEEAWAENSVKSSAAYGAGLRAVAMSYLVLSNVLPGTQWWGGKEILKRPQTWMMYSLFFLGVHRCSATLSQFPFLLDEALQSGDLRLLRIVRCSLQSGDPATVGLLQQLQASWNSYPDWFLDRIVDLILFSEDPLLAAAQRGQLSMCQYLVTSRGSVVEKRHLDAVRGKTVKEYFESLASKPRGAE